MSRRISEEKLNELRQSVNIIDVVSDYVQLKKQGRNYFGLCPFHSENTPSFSVSSSKQIFHCFGCNTGGNVFTFLMEIEGVSFQEAAMMVATKGNVPLEINYEQAGRNDHLPKDQQRMIDAHELLGKFYHHLLVNTKEGEEALDYLLARGFTKEGIKKFQVGYSLPEWEMVVKFLSKRGFAESELEQAGLIIKRENEDGYFDRFRQRIMFPLLNQKGRTIAFSARALADDDHPKYLNTPDTAIFNKSSLLYNYYDARSEIRKQQFAVLFEGFADVISADQANVKNSVAVMGTSLTKQHIELLRRLTDSVLICFDSDQAGAEAAYRAGTMLHEHQMRVTVANLPNGMDPDDYIRTNGKEKFQTDVIGNPLTWTAFKLQYLRLGKNLKNEGEKLNYIEEVMRELSTISNAVERELYLRQLADEFSLSLDVLKQQQRKTLQAKRHKKKFNQRRRQSQPQPKVMDPNIVFRAKGTPRAHVTAERKLIARMLEGRELAYRIKDMLGPHSFHYDEHQAIMTYLFAFYEEGNEPDSSLFIQFMPDKALRAIVTEIEMLTLEDEYSEQELKDYVYHVLKYPKMLKIKEKQSKQRIAERNNDYEKALEIAKEIIELRKSL